jgi:excisionase family DNA binding protein
MSDKNSYIETLEKKHAACIYGHGDGCNNPAIVEMYTELKPESVKPDGTGNYAVLETFVICGMCKGYPKRPTGNIMMTPQDVADYLGMHVNTVRRWSDEGILKAYRIGPRGDRRFDKKDIINFKNSSC